MRDRFSCTATPSNQVDTTWPNLPRRSRVNALACCFRCIFALISIDNIFVRRPKHCILFWIIHHVWFTMHQLCFNPVKGGPIRLWEYLDSKFSSYVFVQCIFAILELSSPWMEAWRAFFARKDAWSTAILQVFSPLLFKRGHHFIFGKSHLLYPRILWQWHTGRSIEGTLYSLQIMGSRSGTWVPRILYMLASFGKLPWGTLDLYAGICGKLFWTAGKKKIQPFLNIIWRKPSI